MTIQHCKKIININKILFSFNISIEAKKHYEKTC